MYAKSIRPSVKRDDQIARSNLRAVRDKNVPAKRSDFFFFYRKIENVKLFSIIISKVWYYYF